MRRRLICLILALGVVAAACGDDDDTTTSDAGTSEAVDGPADTDGAGDGGSDGGDSGGATIDTASLVFDAASLPTDAIPAALIDFSGVGSEAPSMYPPAVVDTCAAIDAATFDEIVAEYDSFGDSDSFSAAPLGSACRFSAITHRIDVIIGSPDDLGDDFIDSILPIAAGDVSTRPSSLDPDAEIITEDSFGIETPFAWRVSNGELTVVVRNTGGTGLLIGDDDAEEGFTATALAALEGAAGLPAGGAPAEATDDSAADPCAVYEPAELEAAFGVPFTETPNSGDDFTYCDWTNDEIDLDVRLELFGPDANPLLIGASEELGDNRWTGGFLGSRFHLGDDYRFSVEIITYSDAYGLEGDPGTSKDAGPLADALIDNILARAS
ncbi:MAG: hypothetical protein KDB21_17280 [Acidimicrobiales bacterium]|nr:hypothetical protein [Acidimicrobiales bacterium]